MPSRYPKTLVVAVGGILLLAILWLTGGRATATVHSQETPPAPDAETAPMLPAQPPSAFGLELPRYDLRHLGGGAMPAGIDVDALPAAFDWRSHTNAGGQPIVSPVKNQSSLGVCWAFAAVGQLEAKLALANLGSHDLSEQSTANCPAGKRGGGNACSGGASAYAYNWWAQAGTHQEAQNPYLLPPSCGICPVAEPYGFTVTSWEYVTGATLPDPAVLKARLLVDGPLWVTVKAGNTSFRNYDGVNPIMLTLPASELVDHAVLLVGWDDNQAHAGGQGVWIAQNSWNTTWGQNGFFEIAYGSANFGMYATTITGVEAYDPSGELLFHDPRGYTHAKGFGNTTAWGLVEFAPTKNDVCATQVELFTTDRVQNLDVYLYDDLIDGQPQSLLAQKLDSQAGVGYTAVKFDAPIPISAGNLVYVVARVQNKTLTYPLTIDSSVTASGANRISTNGMEWSDLGNPLSIRLRMHGCAGLPTPTPTAPPTATPQFTATPTAQPTTQPFPVAEICLIQSVAAGAAATEPLVAAASASAADNRAMLEPASRQMERPVSLAAAARVLQHVAHRAGITANSIRAEPTPGLGYEPPPAPAPSVFGQITVAGAPAVDATIYVYPRDDNGNPVNYDVVGIGTEADGHFALFLAAGSYYLDFEPGEANGYVTVRRGVEITTPAASLDLGEVAIPAAENTISGQVLRDGATATGLAGVLVFAYNDVTNQLVYTVSDEDGQYGLGVGSGRWEVAIFPSGQDDWVYADPPQVALLDAGNSEATVDLAVVTATGYVTGRILDPAGNPLPLAEDANDGVNYDVSVDLWEAWSGIYTFAYVDASGAYRAPVIVGDYTADVWLGGEIATQHAGPHLDPVRFSGSDIALGNINVLERSVTLQGTVTRQDGSPAPDIAVEIWQPGGAWQQATTGADGVYEGHVPPGDWLLQPTVPGYIAQVYTGETATVHAEASQRITQDFGLEEASGWLNGTVVDEAGNLLTEVEASAYLRCGDTSSPFAVTPVRFGRFQMKAPLGEVQAGLYLAPNTPYSALGSRTVATMHGGAAMLSTQAAAIAELVQSEQQVVAGAGMHATLPPFVLRRDDATLYGQLVDDAGVPLLGIPGRASVLPVAGGRVSKESRIDPATGGFTMTLASGRWALSYRLETDRYRQTPIEPIIVEVAPDQVATAAPAASRANEPKFAPDALDGMLLGEVVDATGNGVALALVIAKVPGGILCYSSTCRDEFSTHTDYEGNFLIYVPLSRSTDFDIYASTQPCVYGTPPEECLVNAVKYSVRALPRPPDVQARRDQGTVELQIPLRSADTLLVGQVLDAAGVPWAQAEVFGWTVDGQQVTAATDANGCFRLPFARAGSYVVSAGYTDRSTWTQYSGSAIHSPASWQRVEVMASTIQLQRERTLPAPALRTVDTTRAAGYALDDGMQLQLPAGALPTQSQTVKLAIEPRAELPVNVFRRPIGYAYRITAYDDAGKVMLQNLHSPAQLTLRYTTTDLGGYTPGQVRPALRKGETWEVADSYVVEPENNKVTVSTRQLGEWALVIVTGQETRELYLPMIQR